MNDIGLRINDAGSFSISYRSEADVRSGLAALARAYGWDVQEEVVVPGWGRIDIVLRENVLSAPFLLELKVELDKPARVRRAFQQVDGYSRWWTKEKGEQSVPVLVACKFNHAYVEAVADAYPTVAFRSIGQAMDGMCSWGTDQPLRRMHVMQQILRLEQQRAIHDKALAALGRHVDIAEARTGAQPDT